MLSFAIPSSPLSYPTLYYPTLYILGKPTLYYRTILYYTVLYYEALTVEVFDGKAWTSGTPMVQNSRHRHGVAVLSGYIYVVGGKSADLKTLSSVERFDPTSGTYYSIPYYTSTIQI